MVKFLNDVLGSESGKCVILKTVLCILVLMALDSRLYFETAAQHAAFTPLEVATVRCFRSLQRSF